ASADRKTSPATPQRGFWWLRPRREREHTSRPRGHGAHLGLVAHRAPAAAELGRSALTRHLFHEGLLLMPHVTPTTVLGTIGNRFGLLWIWLLVAGVIWFVYVLTFVGTIAGSVERIEDACVIVSIRLPNGDQREQAYSARDASSEYRVGDPVTVYCLPLIKG